MKLKIRQTNKLSPKLFSSLNILKSSIDDLYEKANELKLETGIDVIDKRVHYFANLKSSITDKIELLTISKESFFDDLINQIDSSRFFPTKKSKAVAKEILKDLNSEGFFEGDEEEIAKRLDISVEFVKSVRERFCYLTPAGVGAKDIKEALLFQLFSSDIEGELFEFTKRVILNLESIELFKNNKLFNEAIKVLKSFNLQFNLEYIENQFIIPEIIVLNRDGNLEVVINDENYPVIDIDEKQLLTREDLKKVRNFVDALELRKSTLKKISLMIVELQYEFFMGGDIKPMKIQDISDELGYNVSTISRAIANKYLYCDRGLIELKSFFSFGFNEEISSSQIKKYIQKLIEKEDKSKPLSDEAITKLVNEKFKIDLVRRTISKYRKQLKIPGSRQRKIKI